MNFYVITTDADSMFCRIADTSGLADDMVDWFNDTPGYSGTYSHATVNVTDALTQHLYCHAASRDKASFEMDAAIFGGVSGV